MAKKKKKAVKKSAPRAVKHELVVRVQPQEVLPVPTTQELSEPMKDGKKLTVPATWLSDKQILRMVQVTPKAHVYKRKGKGGQVWDYVTGAYVEKVLNFVFGWNWDFDVVEHGVMGDFIWAKCRLTVKDGKGNTISKTQFGRKEIAYKKEAAHKPENMLDFGNDLKAASTDGLKKCASLLGIASDIYSKVEYKQETDREPQEAVIQTLPPKERVAKAVEDIKEKHSEPTYHCVGAKGKGCAYGIPEISKAEHDYSMKLYKKPLCRDCQKDAKANH